VRKAVLFAFYFITLFYCFRLSSSHRIAHQFIYDNFYNWQSNRHLIASPVSDKSGFHQTDKIEARKTTASGYSLMGKYENSMSCGETKRLATAWQQHDAILLSYESKNRFTPAMKRKSIQFKINFN